MPEDKIIVHHGTALEGQQRLLALGLRVYRKAILLILIARSLTGLGEVGFDLDGGAGSEESSACSSQFRTSMGRVERSRIAVVG